MGRKGRKRKRRQASAGTNVVLPKPGLTSPIKPSGMKFGLGGNLMKNLQVNAPQKNPIYFEDWDVDNDGDIDVSDAQMWVSKGRQDLARRVSTMIGEGNFPAKRPVPSKNITKKQSVRKVYGIPRKRWMKMKPNARRAHIARFKRSARAKAQRTRRQNRMFRGAARLTGTQPTSQEQGRLRRTSRRMHLTLDRARRKRRIRQ
mgnify:CR=1 FL=1